ncbi:hypothetical protein BGZ72_002041 [Mortierella alpina]|nr:hypothetical protein BGZ72_002041 [Mortierella alpina]
MTQEVAVQSGAPLMDDGARSISFESIKDQYAKTDILPFAPYALGYSSVRQDRNDRARTKNSKGTVSSTSRPISMESRSKYTALDIRMKYGQNHVSGSRPPIRKQYQWKPYTAEQEGSSRVYAETG